VTDAILEVTDNGLSQYKAAQKYGVPQTTLSKRMRGQGAQGDQLQPGQRLTRNQEDHLATWILRQEALGYAPSHSQIRACVLGLLQRLGDTKELGQNWVSRYIERRPELKGKIGRRQEANRFDNFTPKAVNWYFNVREEYSWIKPENTVNVDKGGIMSGFGTYIITQ